MDQADLKQAMGKPQMLRLKQVGLGIKVGKVMGARVLVKTVKPWTEADEVEKKGLLYVPESVKKENTPLPTTGIIIMTGPDVPVDFLQAGDMVMFPKFAGSDFQIENEDLRIIESKEILCTLVDTEESLMEVRGE